MHVMRYHPYSEVSSSFNYHMFEIWHVYSMYFLFCLDKELHVHYVYNPRFSNLLRFLRMAYI